MYQSKISLTLFLSIIISIKSVATCPINVKGSEAMSMGVYIEDIRTGKVLLDYESSKVFSPASVTKSFTTATALSLLPENFRFETPVYISGEIKNSVLYGDLIIYGCGDATLESEHFPNNLGFCDSIADALVALGITTIEGKCKIKNKDFNKDCGVNPNWELEDIAWGYGTGLYPFNYKDNIFNLSLSSTVRTTPNVNDLSIIELHSNGSNGIELMRPFNSNDLYVVGNVDKKNGYSNTCSMPFPEDVFVDELILKFKKKGILLKQENIEGVETFKEYLIYTHKSPCLDEILKSLMVRSDNLFAESILRATAKGRSLNNAIDSELKMWQNRGLNTSFISIRDGSGLSRTNRLSPQFIASMLKWMNKSSYIDRYVSFFPLSGKTGTLKNFLKGTKLEGRLALKTGSMNGVQCYAGYKIDKNNKPTHIVIVMVNHFFCQRAALRTAIEKMLLNTL